MSFNNSSNSFKVPTAGPSNATFKHDNYENVEAVKNIISPSGDLTDVPFAIFPIYIPNYVGVVPIFLMGALFNGFVMVTILLNKKKLLVSRLDQFMFLLIVVFFLWSVACFVEFFASLVAISVQGYIAEAIISSFSIVMIFCVNLLLALERYFLIMGTPAHLCERIITGVIVMVGILCGLILGIFVRTAIDMDHAELVESWSLTMYGALLIISTAVVVVYVRTYFRSSRLVRESLGLSKKKGLVARIRTIHRKHGNVSLGDDVSESDASGGMDAVSVAIERRILFNSIVMASSLILCYLPGIILQVIPNVLHLRPEVAVFWSNVSEVSLSLDVLITPALILYFRRDIRDVLLQYYINLRQRSTLTFELVWISTSIESTIEFSSGISSEVPIQKSRTSAPSHVYRHMNASKVVPTSVFPVYDPEFLGVVPVFALGIILNGAVGFILLKHRSTLILSRVDRLFALITATMLLWSLWCLSDLVVEWVLQRVPIALFLTEEITSCIMILLIFGVNLMLAMERYFIVSGAAKVDTDKYFLGVIVAVSLIAWIIVWFNITSPPSPGLKNASNLKVVFRIIYGYCILSTIVLTFLYIQAYRISTRKLRESLAAITLLAQNATLKGISDNNNINSESMSPELIRTRLEGKILGHCIVMASGLIVCYLPAILLNLAPFMHPGMSIGGYRVWGAVAEMFLAADVAVTPMLVLFFKPEIHEYFRVGRSFIPRA
ncbi:hypothetical protein HDU81_003922 [Chytriomyces hyalinus]|nr:hypothetical protein HDU81_003922 [Chytriomyces hyalinus]